MQSSVGKDKLQKSKNCHFIHQCIKKREEKERKCQERYYMKSHEKRVKSRKTCDKHQDVGLLIKGYI